VIEASEEAVGAAQERVRASLDGALSRGKVTAAAVVATQGRIRFTTSPFALADRDLVIEATSEREEVKLDLFTRVGATLVKDAAILTSNTSSIPIVKFGAAYGRASNVMGGPLLQSRPGDAARGVDPVTDHQY